MTSLTAVKRMQLGFVAAVLLFVPLILFAQSDDQLRAQIRADLMKDPRTAQMSSSEIDIMVNALAQQAQSEGTADTYLDGRKQPVYTFPPPQTGGGSLASIGIALAALLLALLGIVVYVLRRKKSYIPEAFPSEV